MNLRDLAAHLQAAAVTTPFLVNPRTPFLGGRVHPEIGSIRSAFDLALRQIITDRSAGREGMSYSDITPLTWHATTDSFNRITGAIEQAQAATAFSSPNTEASRTEESRNELRIGARVRITGDIDQLYDDGADPIADTYDRGDAPTGTIIDQQAGTTTGWIVQFDDGLGEWWINTANLEVIE